MSGVRVLAGTRKGAFVLTSDGKRDQWEVSGPHFGGWEIYHVKGSPADPDRLYASQSSGWSGQVIQRSDDGGATWAPVGNQFAYDGTPGTHQWYDGTPHPWEFARVWHLEPSLDDPDVVYAGVEDAGLFRSADGGQTLAGAARAARPRVGPVLAAGRGRDVPAHDPAGPVSTGADVRRDLGGGRVPLRRRRARAGGRSTAGCSPRASPTRTRRSGTACTGWRCTRPGQACCSCRSTGTSCAATTAANPGGRSLGTCRPTSGSPSTCMPTSRTPSTWCRSPATPSTSRPRGSCGSTAAGPAATSGSR